MTTMFTIKEASLRAGLNPELLRVWERRYQIVAPQRSDGGYRLYDEADIELLQRMRQLVEGGWKPREAAQHLLESNYAEARADQPLSNFASADSISVTHPDNVAFEVRFVEAAAALDAPRLARLLDELGALVRFEEACDEYLFPALRALGHAWHDGVVSVAGEHLASATVQRWLGVRYDAAARDDAHAHALVGMAPGARHELAALAFAVALRRAGTTTLYLGADLPVSAWVDAAAATGASAAVIGVVIPEDHDPAARTADELRVAAPSLAVAFGGAASHGLEAHGTVLPVPLIKAVRAARALARRR